MSDGMDRDNDRAEGIRSGREERRLPRQVDDARRRDDEMSPRPGGSSGVKTVVIILGVVALIGLCIIGGIIGLLFFGVRSVRESADRMKQSNNYKQIALGMHNYASAKGKLPPVSMTTRSGKPGLSWRVAILPYIEQDSLYRQFKIDEPWDHPDNLKLAARMPRLYAPRPRDEGGDRTHIRVFTGKGAVFDLDRQTTLERITMGDGTANTILYVEATQSVLWIQPDELPFDPKGSLPPLGLPEKEHFMLSMADGNIRWLKKTIAPEKIKAAITMNGGETIVLDE